MQEKNFEATLIVRKLGRRTEKVIYSNKKRPSETEKSVGEPEVWGGKLTQLHYGNTDICSQ